MDDALRQEIKTALETGIIPDFPERGLYRQWDKQWNPIGYGPEPHHQGQLPTNFPPSWSPFACHSMVATWGLPT